MSNFLIFTITGLVAGSVYATSAIGLVVTYTTSRVFNFAHGAVGILVTYLFYWLRVTHGWNEWIAVALCLFVFAPAIGIALDFALMRHLQRAPVAVRLMVTLAIFLSFIGVVGVFWGGQSRYLPPFFGNHSVSPIVGLNITYDQIATVVVAIVVVIGLSLFLNKTRFGTVMRAVVDDRTLSEMHGVRVSLVTAAAWAMGCTLAGLSTMLIAPTLGLSVGVLSTLVVSAYSAAVVGRLRSVSLTLLGAVALGLITSYLTGYLPTSSEIVANLGAGMPFVVLFIALLILRSEHGAKFEKIDTAPEGQPLSRKRVAAFAVGIVVVVLALSPALSAFGALVLALGLIYSLILLSLVLGTGMSGQLSLAQFSFAGLGAVSLGHLDHHLNWFLAAGIAVAITALLGALLTVPALRLEGLYLALYTLAFAVMMDNVFFPDNSVIPSALNSLPVRSPSVLGYHLTTSKSQLWLLSLVVALAVVGSYEIRRRRLGSALAALRDSPAAASSLGLNLTVTKMKIGALSAGLAGLAGCFYGSILGQVSGSIFTYQSSLSALLIIAIYGLGSIPGAVIGAIFYVVLYQLLPVWIHNATWLQALQPLLIAGGVVNLVQHPEGVIAQQVQQLRALRMRRSAVASGAGRAIAAPVEAI